MDCGGYLTVQQSMNDGASPGIDIVIPNFNGRDMLRICLDSLAAQGYENSRVIVVDNGSSDGSVELIGQRYPEVELIELEQNIGFSAAVNLGIERGTKDWVLLLNNDIEMAPHCLEKLAAAIASEPGYRMFALKMLSFQQRDVLDGAGDGVLRGGVGYRLGTMESDNITYSMKREVFGACAGAALYHRALFEQIGLFDADFFAYLEDVDFNLRAVRAGYCCCFVPEARVYHVGSATSGSKINALTVRLTTRNNIWVVCKNIPPLLFVQFLPAFLLYQFFWFLFVVKKRHLFSYIKGISESLPEIPRMARKTTKQAIAEPLSVKEFKQRIIASEAQVIESIISRRTEQGKSSRLLRCYRRLFC